VTRTTTPRRLALIALLAVAGLAGCDKLGLAGATNVAFKGIDITGADYGRELSLPDAEGRPRTLADFKGKVSVVFFGYTQCPDVCPTTMAELARVKQAMGTDGERVQGVFVSVDPERDTPEVLKAYVTAFDPTFVALRGSPEQTAVAAHEFKVFYAKVAGKTPGSYTVDHTAGSYVIDPKGRLRLFERYGAPADDLVSDLRQLLKEG
jgi:protein SCO1/2